MTLTLGSSLQVRYCERNVVSPILKLIQTC